MCPKHSAQHYARLQTERRKAKARKQRAVAAQLAAQQQRALEEEPMTEVRITKIETPDNGTVGRPRRIVNDEVKLDIGHRYEAGETYAEIGAATGASNGAISAVVAELGLPRRNRSKALKEEPAMAEPAPPTPVLDALIPDAQRVALENMLRLPPKPEPVAPTPNLARRRPLTMQRWAISVEGTLIVEAPDISEALRLAQHHDLRILAINPA
jgi:hypothetical protein